MKNLNLKDYTLILILFLIVIGFVLYLKLQGLAFGSNVDWISQHITIPEYLRSLFYQDGKLIPSFALNLGLGQNIFYFAYHGLLSPVILISYLLPFIEMSTYIQVASIIALLASIFLFYIWIKDKYNTNIAFILGIIFVLSGPMIYHSHRHIMFVIYMPFLIWSLINVDKYFKDKKRAPLIISTFLMVMTSFYFSVPGIIAIGIYSLYKVLRNKKIKLKSFKPLTRIVFLVGVGVLLSGVLLLPTIYSLISGRSFTNTAISLSDLFVPHLEYKLTFYYSYSLGMTFIYAVALIYLFLTKKKENLFMGFVFCLCAFFPVVSYLLNGLMYIDGKSFIPFLPLALLIIGNFLNDLFKEKVDIKKLIYTMIPIIIIMLYYAVSYSSLLLLISDIILTISAIIIIYLVKKPKLIYIPIIIISFCSFYAVNNSEQYVSDEDLIRLNSSSYNEFINLIENDYYRVSIYDDLLNQTNKIYSPYEYTSSIYTSSSNQSYLNFVRNNFNNEVINKDYATITQTSNLLFNFYAGTKYLISEAPLKGYKALSNSDNLTLYKNEDVLPVGYASNKIMSLREFNTLSYPQNIDALLNYVVVNKSLENVYNSNIEDISENFQIINSSNLEYEIIDDKIQINALNEAEMQISLDNTLPDDIIIVAFHMDKEKQGYGCSTDIKVNGITNSLACSSWKYHNRNYDFNYVLAPIEKTDNLNLNFTKGEYQISNFKIYKLNYNSIKNIKNNVSELIINSELSDSNTIVGEIDVKGDGYFKITIPYEKSGFSIWIDNQKVAPIKVDNAFLGFEISEGLHNIKIEFNPPLLKWGVIVSIVGLILLLLTSFYFKLSKQIDYVIEKSKSLFINTFKYLKNFVKIHKGYLLLFISMFIIDLTLRLFYFGSINFYSPFKFVPNLFSILWIGFIIFLTKNCNKKLGRIIYLVSYVFSLVMFIVHAIYFSYFQMYFDYEVLKLTGEGLAYLDTVIINIKWWVVIIGIISVYLTIKGLSNIHHTSKNNYLKIALIIIVFISLHSMAPLLLGSKKQVNEWDDWMNPRRVYDSFNDNNKSMMVSGMYEYNLRNFYVTFMRNNKKVSEGELTLLKENFDNAQLNIPNNYTGIFEGKNLILVQLESIDSFLLNQKTMPNTYKMMKESINFTNHYSFTSGGGSTFNSEFMVNTGYSTAYNYNQNAYAFSRNNYGYSMPNLFKALGYTANAFHMNSAEYYSRGVNYKSFGYNNYYGLKDQKQYTKNEFWLDRELINNDSFDSMIFQNNTLSYIITYTAHMPYKTSKGNCPMLTDQIGLTEFECLKIQAAETDNFMGLLLKRLEETGMMDNTVIAVFTDHYVYTLEDKSLLDRHKETQNNLINHTPFFIWSNSEYKKDIKAVNSQLDILPTILNLFGVNYYPNYYLGRDILDPKYNPVVFFPDGSWYNGSTYVANGEYQSGKKMKTDTINKMNSLVKRKMNLNDAVIKADYFKTIATNR